jgi:porin
MLVSNAWPEPAHLDLTGSTMRFLAFSSLVCAFSATLLLNRAVLAADAAPPPPDAAPATPSIQSSLGANGDPGGLRAFLDAKGIDYGFTYVGEVLGNATGGVKQGAIYEGRLDATLDIDTGKLAGIKDGAIHVEAFQIHGRGLSTHNVNDLFTVSNIEAYPDTKLYELWYEQKLFDGKVFIRAGQIAADTEFFLSQAASIFINSSFGFPASLANDLPSGGPAEPLATPGARLKLAPTDQITLLAAVFNGDPAGVYQPGVNNLIPQIRDAGGTAFRLQDPPLVMTEAQYAYNQDKDAKGLPGTAKIGYLHHFESFLALNQPPGVTVTYRGDNGVYGILDQMLYRKPGTDDQGLTAFVRASYLPPDRNLIDVYIDGGLTYKGLIPGRDGDIAGLSAAYAHISSGVSAADALTAAPLVRDYQAVIEATYQIAVMPGVVVQPDFQYVFHPGAHGVADPTDGLPIRDAAVFGVRASLHY